MTINLKGRGTSHQSDCILKPLLPHKTLIELLRTARQQGIIAGPTVFCHTTLRHVVASLLSISQISSGQLRKSVIVAGFPREYQKCRRSVVRLSSFSLGGAQIA